MNWYQRIQTLLQKRTFKAALVLIGLAVLAGWAISQRQSQAEPVPVEQPPVVSVTTAATFSGNSTINLIGTVRAFSEAAITSESAGRVTSVQVGLGDQISAGTVIATLENASQQASVLSAQGSYEVALAALEQSQFGNAQSQVGVGEAATGLRTAQNNAVSTIKSSYNAVEGALFNNIDQFFTNPDSNVPGLRISGQGLAGTVNDRRVFFQSRLPQAEARSRAVTTDSDLPSELAASRELLGEMINYLDTFITIFNQQDTFSRYTQEEVIGFGTRFNTTRGSLIQLQSQIDNALANLDQANDAIRRSEITVTSSNSAAAEAQVKQALGSLRSAQANLAKTIIRTPISGTVNSLDVRTGDFINSFAQIAQVANNNALEVVTFAGTNDLEVIAVGDTVQLENQYTGTVTQIAPAVNAGTGKTEVRIASETPDLQNGDSVRITKEVTQTISTDVIIPLSAVKFALQDGAVFVVENGRLVPRPVTLGTIRGGSVEILDGLSATDEFVADARGLVESTEVEVIRE